MLVLWKVCSILSSGWCFPCVCGQRGNTKFFCRTQGEKKKKRQESQHQNAFLYYFSQMSAMQTEVLLQFALLLVECLLVTCILFTILSSQSVGTSALQQLNSLSRGCLRWLSKEFHNDLLQLSLLLPFNLTQQQASFFSSNSSDAS